MTAWGAYLVKSSRNLNTPKAEVGIGLMMPAHHSSRCDFHFWILLLLLIASPQGTVFKIQVKSCWKSLADQLLQESVMFSFVDICVDYMEKKVSERIGALLRSKGIKLRIKLKFY